MESSEWPMGAPHPCYYGDTTWMSRHTEFQQLDCLFNSLFGLTTNRTLKFRDTWFLWVESSDRLAGAPHPCHKSDTTWAYWHTKDRQLDCLFHSLLQLTTNRRSKLCIIRPLWVESSEWSTIYGMHFHIITAPCIYSLRLYLCYNVCHNLVTVIKRLYGSCFKYHFDIVPIQETLHPIYRAVNIKWYRWASEWAAIRYRHSWIWGRCQINIDLTLFCYLGDLILLPNWHQRR